MKQLNSTNFLIEKENNNNKLFNKFSENINEQLTKILKFYANEFSDIKQIKNMGLIVNKGEAEIQFEFLDKENNYGYPLSVFLDADIIIEFSDKKNDFFLYDNTEKTSQYENIKNVIELMEEIEKIFPSKLDEIELILPSKLDELITMQLNTMNETGNNISKPVENKIEK